MSRNANPLAVLDEIPVTSLVLGAYLAMALLTDPIDPSRRSLIEHGAAVGVLVQDGEPWRLLSYAFLHGGLIHIAFNSYVLWMFGPGLERRMGSVRFAILYVVAALGGGVAGMLWHSPLAPLVGGSGALFGMFGAAVALLMREGRGQLDFLDHHGGRRLLGLIAINLLLGFLIPVVSNAGHIGGLIAGFVCTYLFLDRGRVGADTVTRISQAGWVAVLATGVLWCCFPLLRWDYQLKMAREAADPSVRHAWREVLGGPLGPGDKSALREVFDVERFGDRGPELVRRWVKD